MSIFFSSSGVPCQEGPFCPGGVLVKGATGIRLSKSWSFAIVLAQPRLSRRNGNPEPFFTAESA